MTVSSNNRRAGPYTGNDVTTNFAFTFRMFAAADLVATVADADGVETVLVLDTDYTATLNADQNTSPGGSITMTTALATGETLVITSDVAATQSTDITNAGGFYPDVLETALDRAVVLVQQVEEVLARSVTIPVTSTGVTSLEVPVLAEAVLQWNGDASELRALTLPDLSLYLALPDDTGHSGKFLTTNGAGTKSWAAAPVTSVAGLTGAIAASSLRSALAMTTSDLTDIATYTAQRNAFAIVMALVL